ncbi:MAG: ABC transporter permease, partial [Bacteroidales bacterium]|nr:ABC transporter permease [Bacteroidales bacterium]
MGLATGILCFTICFYITRYTLTTDSCFPNKERIIQIRMEDTESNISFSGTSSAMVEELRSMDIPQLQNIVTIAYPNQMTFNITLSQDLVLPYTFHTIETDEEFLPVYTPEIISGSWESAVAMPNSIVMSESAAIRIFGNVHDAIGKNMTLTHPLWSSPPTTRQDGRINYTIAAVMKDIPGNNSVLFMNSLDILRLNDSEGVINYIKRNPRKISRTTGTTTYVLLREGFTKEDFTKWLADRNYTFKTIGKECRVNAEKANLNSGLLVIAIITGVIGLLVLATSLLNFFNFLVASFYNKTKEYSLRKVYGGEFWHLFKQLYVQSSVIVLLSSLLMLSIIEILGDNAFNFSPDILQINFLMEKGT